MKLLLFGPSGSGKSTLAKLIGAKYNLTVYEADDEVMVINQNVWPHDDAIIDKGFEQANKKALIMDNVIYVTSWLSKIDFGNFIAQKFMVVEISASLEELISRKISRDNSTKEHIDKFRNTYVEYLDHIHDPDLKNNILLSIDSTNLKPGALLEIVSEHLLF